MNSAMKEDLKKRLKQDSISVDLSDIQSLNEDILAYIAKRLLSDMNFYEKYAFSCCLLIIVNVFLSFFF